MALMLTIPDKLPDGAQQALLSERYAATREVMRLGARAYFANLLLIPLAKLLGIGGTWPFVVLSVLLVVQIAMCVVFSRRARPLTRPTWVLLVGNHVLLLTMVGTFFGSLIFVPLFALGSLPNMLLLPQIYNPVAALLVHCFAVALPVTLELTGVIPTSFHIDGQSLVFHPWALEMTPKMIVVMLLAVVAIQLWVTTRIISGNRRAQDRAHELIHAQRWQLDQIVRTE